MARDLKEVMMKDVQLKSKLEVALLIRKTGGYRMEYGLDNNQNALDMEAITLSLVESIMTDFVEGYNNQVQTCMDMEDGEQKKALQERLEASKEIANAFALAAGKVQPHIHMLMNAILHIENDRKRKGNAVTIYNKDGVPLMGDKTK